MIEHKIDNSSTCDKCGKNGVMELQGKHYILKLDCQCGGRFKTDWNKLMKGGK